MVAKKKPLYRPDAVDVAQRLRLLAMALGKTPMQMADDSGIARNTWSQCTSESEPRLITLPQAYRLKKHGVTLDWIYSGDDSGLKVQLVRALNAVPGAKAGRILTNSQD